MIDLKEKIVIIFEHFYNKFYKQSFKLDLKKNRQEIVLDTFLHLLSTNFNIASLNSNFLITYMSYSFSKFSNLDLKRNISFSWIVGKKMLNRFLSRNEQEQYFSDQFLKEYSIDVNQLKAKLAEKEISVNVLDHAEETEKLRFYGEAKLYNCLQNTTLYNHRSVNCLGCDQKQFCKKLLKETYPRIFIKRGYNK